MYDEMRKNDQNGRIHNRNSKIVIRAVKIANAQLIAAVMIQVGQSR